MRTLMVLGALALEVAGCAGQMEPSGLGPTGVGGRSVLPAKETMAVDPDDVRSRAQDLIVAPSGGGVARETMRDIVLKIRLEEPDSPAGLRRRIHGSLGTY